MVGEELRERALLLAAGDRDRPQRAVEADEVADHPPERGAREVGSLAHQTARRSAELEVLVLTLDREAHVARLERHAGGAEQLAEARVVAVVADDEPRVDLPRRVLALDRDRVAVAAEVVGRLEQRDLVAWMQPRRCDDARDAASDDRDPHRREGSGATWRTMLGEA